MTETGNDVSSGNEKASEVVAGLGKLVRRVSLVLFLLRERALEPAIREQIAVSIAESDGTFEKIIGERIDAVGKAVDGLCEVFGCQHRVGSEE